MMVLITNYNNFVLFYTTIGKNLWNILQKFFTSWTLDAVSIHHTKNIQVLVYFTTIIVDGLCMTLCNWYLQEMPSLPREVNELMVRITSQCENVKSVFIRTWFKMSYMEKFTKSFRHNYDSVRDFKNVVNFHITDIVLCNIFINKSWNRVNPCLMICAEKQLI